MRRIASFSLFVTLMILLQVPGIGWAARSPSGKIGWSLAKKMQTAKSQSVPILVFLKDSANLRAPVRALTKEQRGRFVYEGLRQVALRSQGPLVKYLQGKQISFRRYYIVNMVAVEGANASLVTDLARRPDVRKIIWNSPVHNDLDLDNRTRRLSRGPSDDNIEASGAKRVWGELGITGKGIVVAGEDTGIDWQHPALIRQYRGSQGGKVQHDYNWHDAIHQPLQAQTNRCGYDSKVPCDDDEHGTHTMGTVVGDDGGDNKIGIAPAAQWIGCRNMDRGVGSPQTYIECMEFLLAPYPMGGNSLTDGRPQYAPHVINNSWACPKSEGCEGDELLPAVHALSAAGIVFIASAGNEGPGCGTIGDPPAYFSDYVVTVGAINHRNDSLAYFSSRGPSKSTGAIGPDIVAPGVFIRSSVPGGGYASFSGTSMSGPHVTGAVALMWSASEKLRGKFMETRDILRDSTAPLQMDQTCAGIPSTTIPNHSFGHGNVNIYTAVTKAQEY